jgi:hypothetical protein
MPKPSRRVSAPTDDIDDASLHLDNADALLEMIWTLVQEVDLPDTRPGTLHKTIFVAQEEIRRAVQAVDLMAADLCRLTLGQRPQMPQVQP